MPEGLCDFDAALLRVKTRAIARVPDGAQSVLVLALPYYVGAFSYRNVSRYAMLPDYHDVADALLAERCARLRAQYPGERFEPFADISPFDEVELGVRAGLGVRGQNGQLINSRYGSYLFLGEIVSTRRFPPSRPLDGGCLSCGACARACPGGAIREDGFHAEACLSHLTQQKRLDEAQCGAVRRAGMAWGCDACLDVCPHNRRPAYSPIAPFYRNICAVLTNNNLDGVYASRAWTWRGRAVLRRNLSLIEGGRN